MKKLVVIPVILFLFSISAYATDGWSDETRYDGTDTR